LEIPVTEEEIRKQAKRIAGMVTGDERGTSGVPRSRAADDSPS